MSIETVQAVVCHGPILIGSKWHDTGAKVTVKSEYQVNHATHLKLLDTSRTLKLEDTVGDSSESKDKIAPKKEDK